MLKVGDVVKVKRGLKGFAAEMARSHMKRHKVKTLTVAEVVERHGKVFVQVEGAKGVRYMVDTFVKVED